MPSAAGVTSSSEGRAGEMAQHELAVPIPSGERSGIAIHAQDCRRNLRPDCRTMNRQAASPFGLLVGITQMPAMDGTFASEAAGG